MGSSYFPAFYFPAFLSWGDDAAYPSTHSCTSDTLWAQPSREEPTGVHSAGSRSRARARSASAAKENRPEPCSAGGAGISGSFNLMGGEVEVDETYIGGKSRNMHKAKRETARRWGIRGKAAVMGLLERHGPANHSRVKAVVVPGPKRKYLHTEIIESKGRVYQHPPPRAKPSGQSVGRGWGSC